MSDEFRVEIHKGEGYTPGPDVMAALEALATAIADEDGDEVSGFAGHMLDFKGALLAPSPSNITVCAAGRYKQDSSGTECTGVYVKFP